MKSPDSQTTRFMGLNNVSDPLSLGLEWLTTANNVHITDAGKIERRDGHTLDTAGAITGAYGTLDHERLYLVADGALQAKDGPTIATDLAADRMYWAEVNEDVFYANGTDYGIIKPDNTRLPWSWPVPGTPTLAAVSGSLDPGKYDVICTYLLDDGRETGAGQMASIDITEGQALQISDIPQVDGAVARVYIAPANSTVFQLAYEGYQTARTWNYSPDSLGIDLMTDDFDPVPAGATVIAAWRGRIYAAQYFPADDMTAIWYSQPLGFHLFNLSSDFVAVPGKVLMLAGHANALVIGTDKAVSAYDGENMATLATYGVVPGCAWDVDDTDPGRSVYFWTVRGLCRFPEFANLTNRQISVAPGVQAGAAVMHADGQRRFVVALHQGSRAFNQRVS